jgi:NAD-dependent SIR2 family protein deacetylase
MDDIQKAKKIINDSEALLITAGAGMGVDSGLPDFRGVEGFWRAYPVVKRLGLRFEEMANPRWFRDDPHLAWAFYGHRYNLYKNTKPHEGFYKILKRAKELKGGYFVFTSNVDGAFQKSGYDENRILEIHGSINHMQCLDRCSDEIYEADFDRVDIDEESFKAIDPLPSCVKCGSLVRPNILMFGDFEWLSDRSDAQSSRLQLWLDSVRDRGLRLTIVEFGAGEAIPTVRVFGENLAKREDTTLIRVNPRDYEVPKNCIGLPLGAKEAIEMIF